MHGLLDQVLVFWDECIEFKRNHNIGTISLINDSE